MRTFGMLLAVGALLGGCAHSGEGGGLGVDPLQGAVAGVIAAEAAAIVRCPASPVELAVFMAARAGFDLTFGARLDQTQRGIVDQARAATDQACGIGAVAAPVQA